jgi:Na+/phosphate symporter
MDTNAIAHQGLYLARVRELAYRRGLGMSDTRRLEDAVMRLPSEERTRRMADLKRALDDGGDVEQLLQGMEREYRKCTKREDEAKREATRRDEEKIRRLATILKAFNRVMKEKQVRDMTSRAVAMSESTVDIGDDQFLDFMEDVLDDYVSSNSSAFSGGLELVEDDLEEAHEASAEADQEMREDDYHGGYER